MARTLLEILIESNIEIFPSSSGRSKGRCPFHEGDNDPSFTVYPNETYYCFGCHEWGDSVKFLVEYKGLTAKEALEYVGLDYKQPKAEKTKVIKVKNTVQTWEFVHKVATEYQNYLERLPGARNYLLGRGLTEETIKRYKIGYTDGKVLNLMFAYERQLAQEVGLMTKESYETMGHRITIPNIIQDGRCDFLMGRTIINDNVKYLGTRMPKPLIGFHEIRKSPVIFMVEGQFDWLTLRQWGYPAICLSGTAMKPYIRLPLMGKDVIMVPDIDDEGHGMREGKKLVEPFGNQGFILDISELRQEPGKLDINKLAEQPDGETKFKQLLLRSLPWITSLSPIQLKAWFPTLIDSTLLLSTSRQLA